MGAVEVETGITFGIGGVSSTIFLFLSALVLKLCFLI
jgi:hypothetical protein